VLANVAHQRFELRDFFSSFNRDLANCAPRRDYGLPAKIAGSRYLRTLMPIVSGLLGAVIAPGRLSVLARRWWRRQQPPWHATVMAAWRLHEAESPVAGRWQWTRSLQLTQLVGRT
jgi:hypothetical protein